MYSMVMVKQWCFQNKANMGERIQLRFENVLISKLYPRAHS